MLFAANPAQRKGDNDPMLYFIKEIIQKVQGDYRTLFMNHIPGLLPMAWDCLQAEIKKNPV